MLVNYTCNGSSLCPSSAVEQFDFGCSSSGEWTRTQFSNSLSARDENPLADFMTDLRTDCQVCSTQGSKSADNYDDVTHCHGKSRMFLPELLNFFCFGAVFYIVVICLPIFHGSVLLSPRWPEYLLPSR